MKTLLRFVLFSILPDGFSKIVGSNFVLIKNMIPCFDVLTCFYLIGLICY